MAKHLVTIEQIKVTKFERKQGKFLMAINHAVLSKPHRNSPHFQTNYFQHITSKCRNFTFFLGPEPTRVTHNLSQISSSQGSSKYWVLSCTFPKATCAELVTFYRSCFVFHFIDSTMCCSPDTNPPLLLYRYINVQNYLAT